MLIVNEMTKFYIPFLSKIWYNVFEQKRRDNVLLQPLTDADFREAFELLSKSFPLDEYRPYEAQRVLLEHPLYRAYILKDDESTEIRALITVWKLEKFVFIEHFAVAPACRNQGLGAKILQEVKEMLSARLVLEAELPETDLARRRIGFYQRNGFTLNEYPYLQPSYGKGREAVPLFLMTTGGSISEGEFEAVKSALYKTVYGK
jgi:ribosomal protein S18 acetylase RimI-like enzyme